ncbi:MAG: hypothetical protein ACUVV0_00905 [Anaerolineae bacterium]
MSLQTASERFLQRPAPARLWELQIELLALRENASEEEARWLDLAQDAAREFFLYLSELQSKTEARNFNELASLLDIGAVGTVALESLLTAESKTLEKLLLGGLSESLMVFASRQYVKAWKVEAEPLHKRAAWYLFGELWRLSQESQPAIPPKERKIRLNALLAPALSREVPEPVKTVLLGRIFQILLLIYLTHIFEKDSEK